MQKGGCATLRFWAYLIHQVLTMCLVDQMFDPVSRRFNFDDGRMSIAGHAHHRSDLLNVLWVIGYLELVIRFNRKYSLDCNHVGTV